MPEDPGQDSTIPAQGARPWKRIRDRKLVQWLAGYVAACWVLLQVADNIAQWWGWQPVLMQRLQVALLLGMAPVGVVAWFHGERGRQRVSFLEVSLLSLITLAAAFVFRGVVRAPAGPPDEEGRLVTVSLDRTRIVVPPFENATTDPELDALGDLAATWISGGISREHLGTPYPTADLVAVSAFLEANPGANPPLQLLADATGGGTFLQGRLLDGGRQVEVHVELIDLTHGVPRVVQSIDPVPLDPTDPSDGIAEVQRRVLGLVASYLSVDFFTPMAADPSNLLRPPSLVTFRAFRRAQELSMQDTLFAEGAKLMWDAYRQDTVATFMLPSIAASFVASGDRAMGDSALAMAQARIDRMSPAELANLEYVRAWVDRDKLGLWQVARTLPEVSPGTGLHYLGGAAAYLSDHSHTAVEILSQLEADRGFVGGIRFYWTALTSALMHVGDFKEAMAVAERAQRRHPNWIEPLEWQAASAVRLGQLDTVERLVRAGQVVGGMACGALRIRLAAAKEANIAGLRQISDSLTVALLHELDAAPENARDCPFDYGRALLILGDWPRGVEHLRAFVDVEPRPATRAHLGAALAAAGDRAGAEQQIALIEAFPGPEAVRAEYAGFVRAWLGDTDKALDGLRKRLTADLLRYDLRQHVLALPLRADAAFLELTAPLDRPTNDGG
ncbi:MAG: hypothetical protein R3E10_19605 [Gemmatimonadota bacterium]